MVGRIRLGKQSDASYGLRISQAAYDVSTNPVDDEKLIFNSDWPEVLPIHQVGAISHRTTAQQGTTVVSTVSHSLGFIPFVDFIVRGNGNALPSGTDIYPTSRYYDRSGMEAGLRYWEASGPDGAGFLRCNITSTQVRIESSVRNGPSNNSFGLPRTWTVYYVIYKKAVI